MEYKLKIDKKTGTFKITLPEGDNCVILCKNGLKGLVPISIELPNGIKVETVEALLKDESVTQVTFIPYNYMEAIHILKEWRPIKENSDEVSSTIKDL